MCAIMFLSERFIPSRTSPAWHLNFNLVQVCELQNKFRLQISMLMRLLSLEICIGV